MTDSGPLTFPAKIQRPSRMEKIFCHSLNSVLPPPACLPRRRGSAFRIILYISTGKLVRGERVFQVEWRSDENWEVWKKSTNLIVPIPRGLILNYCIKRSMISHLWFIARFQSFSIHYSFQIVFKLSVEEKRPLGDAEMKIIFKYSCPRYLIIESLH